MSETKQKVAEVKKAKPISTSLIDYAPKTDVPQEVVGFDGKDKASKNAKAAFAISRYFISNQGMKSFSASDAHNLVLEQTGVALVDWYPKSSYSDSPLHKALHSLSKGETMEKRENKEGEVIDTVARGIRGLLRKDIKVGIQQTGLYHKNTDPKFRKYYKKVEPAELKSACMTIIQNSRAGKEKS